MAKKEGTSQFEGPVRMCVVCRQRLPERELMRYVRTEDGALAYDAEQTSQGRGWYVCRQEACQKKFLKFRLSPRHMGGKQ